MHRFFPGAERVLVTADLNAHALIVLRRLGNVQTLGWASGGWFADPQTLSEAVRDVTILVAGYEPITADILDGAPRLRLIVSIRSDPRANIDVEAATARGVAVLHTTGRSDVAVAEFTIGVMLCLARQLVPAVDWMRHRPDGFPSSDPSLHGTVWGTDASAPQLRFKGIELEGRTLGLVGFGSIGRKVARKASGLGMRVIAHDPYVSASTVVGTEVEMIELRPLLETADVVSLHARLTPSSRGLLGATQLSSVRDGALLINTARAELIDHEALVGVVLSGRLGGIALDVFYGEPPDPGDPLVAHPAVLPTPHVAAWTRELSDHHSRTIAEELTRLLEGQPLRNVVNPEAW